MKRAHVIEDRNMLDEPTRLHVTKRARHGVRPGWTCSFSSAASGGAGGWNSSRSTPRAVARDWPRSRFPST